MSHAAHRPSVGVQIGQTVTSIPANPIDAVAKLESAVLAAAVHFEVQADTVSRIVYVRGELDFATAPRLVEAVEFLAAIGSGRALIDMEAVTFIDAAGLSAFIEARRILAQQRYDVTLVNPSHLVRRIFAIGGLAALLPTA
jgi:anti-sigma B factor antagonist